MAINHTRMAGFTLVELMVALTIATILIVASIGICGRLTQTSQFRQSVESAEQRQHRIIPIIAADLRQAVRCRAMDDSIILLTSSRFAPETLEHSHAVTEVHYHTVTIDGVTWLVRDQQDPPLRQLLCSDVESWRITSAVSNWKLTRNWSYVPSRLKIELTVLSGSEKLSLIQDVRRQP